MKKFCLTLLLLFSTLFLFADDDNDKLKLAVMEFEDTSGQLSEMTLSNATQYIRSAFVASKRFIVIAKERQEKVMIKEMKKESYKSCNDKNCQIPLGQALSADTILRTTITFFGGIYTITSELIDLAKEATVNGAKDKFDGSEKSLMQALDRIMVQIAGTAVAYNIEAMQTQEIQGVKLGGVELDTMPKIEVKEANFGEVQNTYTVSELNTNAGISLDAAPDVLVLYDKCVKADRNGENDPEKAADLWKQLSQIKEKNPFLSQAEKRYSDWGKYAYLRQLANLFEYAKTADKAGQIFPKKAAQAWSNLFNKSGTDYELRSKLDNPYEQTASERYTFWSKYVSQVDKYREQLQKFEEQRKEDVANLEKILPLEVINDAQKRTVLVQYMEIYSPFYGVEDVDNVIFSMDEATAKHIYPILHNDYLKKEMAEKCDNGNGSACYVSAALTEVEDPQKSNMFFAQSCEKGIVNACVKTGKIYYNIDKKKEAAKLFYEACGMESPEGCHIAAFVTEKGAGITDDLILAAEIYQKACDLGYEASCKQAKELAGINSENVERIKLERKQEEERRIEAEKQRKAEKHKAQLEKDRIEKMPQELDKAGRKTRKAIATTTLVSGIVVTVLGGVSFYGMNEAEKDRKKYFVKYLDAEKEELIVKYRKKAQDADKKRKTYTALGGVGIGLGLALITTSVVLYSVDFKGEKEVKKKYELSFGASPADTSLYITLNW